MKKACYTAQYIGAPYSHNHEREKHLELYERIGDAIAEAMEEIEKQQSKNPGYNGMEITAHGEHGVIVKPRYEGTLWNSETRRFDNSTQEGQWESVVIRLQDIK